MKNIRLTQSEIDNAADYYSDNGQKKRQYTIIRRLQADGRYWLAAIDIGTNAVIEEKYADDKEGVREAIHEVNRWLDKCANGGKMSDISRTRWNVKEKYKKN